MSRKIRNATAVQKKGTTTDLIIYADQASVVVPDDASKDERYRLGKFSRWLAQNRSPWHKPDLATYRDHMLDKGYAPSTVSTHLSTVRGRYADILRADTTRDAFYTLASERLAELSQADTPANRKAFVDEAIARLQNALDPAASSVKVETVQDRADDDHIRLTIEQASALIASPGVGDPVGLRDTAIIALALCTGAREAELSNLETRDLRTRFGGELALRIRKGKGCKTRSIPYGELSWCLAIVDKWLEAAGISEGPVFRGFYRGNRSIRPGNLKVRQIQNIIARYPVIIDGRLTRVRFHDLRRTYARRLYVAGVDPVAIQQNLGHADLKTTLGYIGTLDADARRAPAVYEFDLNGLAAVRVDALQGRDEK